MDQKKWITIALAAVLLIGLVLGILAMAGAFGPTKVGLCLRLENGQWNEYHTLLEQQLVAEEYQVHTRAAANDQSTQTRQVQALLKEGCRTFIIEPVDTAAENLLQTLEKAGASVVFINYMPQQLEQYPDFSYVGFDPAQAGELQAQIIAGVASRANHNGDAELSYAVLDTDMDAARLHSFEAALGNAVCLEHQVCGSDVAKAEQQTRLLLSRYGRDMEIIFCGSDALAQGALAAIEDGGRKVGEDILLIGANATEQSLQLVKEGKLTGTLVGDIQSAAAQVLQLLGSRKQVIFRAEYFAVDQKNVDDYIK